MQRAIIAAVLGSSLALLGCSRRDATQPAEKPIERAPAADNTGRNLRDQNGVTVTPLDQSNSETDLKLTQDLRQQLVNDDGLSFDAKNIKIITSQSVVTLRGPVRSQTEKQQIESRARALPGVASVNDELEVVVPQ